VEIQEFLTWIQILELKIWISDPTFELQIVKKKIKNFVKFLLFLNKSKKLLYFVCKVYGTGTGTLR